MTKPIFSRSDFWEKRSYQFVPHNSTAKIWSQRYQGNMNLFNPKPMLTNISSYWDFLLDPGPPEFAKKKAENLLDVKRKFISDKLGAIRKYS